MFSIRKSIAMGVFIACFSGLVFAQGGATGAITGTVSDASGAVVAGAKVDIVREATGQVERHLTTDSAGALHRQPLARRQLYRRSQRLRFCHHQVSRRGR